MEILWETDDLIAVVKPPELVSEQVGDGSGLGDLLAERNGGYVGVIHRMDRGVGGVTVYAKNREMAAILSAADNISGAAISAIPEIFSVRFSAIWAAVWAAEARVIFLNSFSAGEEGRDAPGVLQEQRAVILPPILRSLSMRLSMERIKRSVFPNWIFAPTVPAGDVKNVPPPGE